MNDEDEFQAMLDANPDDHTTRLVLADWFEERGDPRADGYRALGMCRLRPQRIGQSWVLYNLSEYRAHDPSVSAAMLPVDWFRELHAVRKKFFPTAGDTLGWCDSRCKVEDAAAIAFAELSPERRAELLAGKK